MKNRRTVIAIGAIVVVVCLCARPLVLFKNSRQIEAISATFPREYTVGDPSNPKVTYVALGDSTAMGTGAQTLEQTLPYQIALRYARRGYCVKVINRGVSGAKIADVISNQLDGLEKLHAKLITLNVGSNDATHFTDFTEYDHNLSVVLAAITQDPSCSVEVATVPNLNGTPALQPLLNGMCGWRAQKQNLMLQNQVNGTNIKIADLYTNAELTDPSDYAIDQFHPSGEGYAKWAKLY